MRDDAEICMTCGDADDCDRDSWECQREADAVRDDMGRDRRLGK